MSTSSMNNTKWNEVRLAMLGLDPTPCWTTLSTNGYRSEPDFEWYYHFGEGGYEDILELEILVNGSAQKELVRTALKLVHVPGEETADGFRVIGYIADGQTVDYV